MGAVYYHTSVSAAGSVAAAKEIEIGRLPATVNVSLNANLSARGDLVFHPVLGGRFAVGVTGLFGNVNTSVAGTLTASLGPLVAMRSGLISDELTGVGDLYPMATLKWNNGGNNAGLVGIEVGVVSGVINLESSGVEASDWRPRHDEVYHEA